MLTQSTCKYVGECADQEQQSILPEGNTLSNSASV